MVISTNSATRTLSQRSAVLVIAAVLLLISGCAATDSTRINSREELGQEKRGAAYKGQIVTLIFNRRSDLPMSYRRFAYPYETRTGSEFIERRDATQIVQAILVRELNAAGYQPLVAESRANEGDQLGVRYEVTRAWTTQLMTGVWPTTSLYRALISSHVSVFRGDTDCMAQSYFAEGEGTSAWSAFSRALDRLLGQSVPELMSALSGCGTPVAETK